MRVQCFNLFLLTAICSTASGINANNHQQIIVARNRRRTWTWTTSSPAFIDYDSEKKSRRCTVLNVRGGEDSPQTASSEETDDIEVPVSTPKSNVSEDLEAGIDIEDVESELTETETETEYDFESYDDEDAESEATSSSVTNPEEISEVEGSSKIDVEVMIQNQDSIESSLTSSADEEENVAYDMLVREIELLQNKALELRSKGKELHDSGDFTLAADTFQKAANELEAAVKSFGEQEDIVTEKIENVALSTKLAEERATCRLHEALCHLKNKNYAESISSCTDVLLDGVQVVQADEESEDELIEDGDEDEEAESEDVQNEEDVDDDKKKKKTMVVRVSPTGGGGVTVMKNTPELSPAVRARAYHRRAKARLALGDTSGALEDSRSAAFLGDRNAVALYGRLMRESGGSSAGSSNMGSLFSGSGGQGSNPMGSLFGSSSAGSSSPFASMLTGNSPFSAGGNSDGGASMLSSLLSGAGPSSSDSSPAMPSFNPLSMLGAGLGGNSGAGGPGGMGGLAKSVLSSVYKRAEDKSTQEQICNYLNKLDTAQLVSLSGMAGSPLNESTAERIVSFAHGVTPRGIKKGVKLIKRLVLVGSFLNKTVKIIGKYKHLLILIALIGWTKSAIMRPVVISKKAVKKAAKAAESISKAAFM